MNYITITYMGTDYHVPETGRREDAAIFDSIPSLPDGSTDWNHARAFLMQDGNLAVPGGRYGRDTRDCAEIAIIIARVMEYHSGESATYYSLNGDMGHVVNGSDDVGLTLLRDAAIAIDGFDIADYLDQDEIDAAREYERIAYGE